MRASEKMALIDRIGRELHSRFSFREIDAYLREFQITTAGGSWSSKLEYAKASLHGEPTDRIIAIAEDLDLENLHAEFAVSAPPKNWIGTSKFRLFISHLAKQKDRAIRLKECLVPYEISGFVAHEDIHPTLEWQLEIEHALYTMDAFLAIHTLGFKDSYWAQQEVGFALGRGVKIISFKMEDEDPTGFISKHQALPRRNRTAEQIAEEVDAMLSVDPLTSAKLKLAKQKAGKTVDNDLPF